MSEIIEQILRENQRPAPPEPSVKDGLYLCTFGWDDVSFILQASSKEHATSIFYQFLLTKEEEEDIEDWGYEVEQLEEEVPRIFRIR